MNARQQEADRLRMERALMAAEHDIDHAWPEAGVVTPLGERAAAWQWIADTAGDAHRAITDYMSAYGLLPEGVE